jgi:hypothetical protein
MTTSALDIDAMLEKIDRLPWRQKREALQLIAAERADIEPLTQYQRDPVGYIVHELGVPLETLHWSINDGYNGHAWDGSPDPLIAMLEGLSAWEDVGVEAATSTQKSYTAACAVLWFLACWNNAQVFTFAPGEKQLRLFIWKHIGQLFPRFKKRFPTAELTDLCLRVRGGTDESWAAHGFAVAQRAGEAVSVNAQGMHERDMLLIYEEGPGIAPAVIEAGENTSTAPHNLRLMIGNPDHQYDTLHQFCTAPDVRHVIISAFDHPNVVTGREIVPGAVSTKSIDRRRVKYNKNGIEGRLFRSRVRGISPPEAAEALIQLEWVKLAQAKWSDEAYRVGKKALGVDVANSLNGDEGAIAYGQGWWLEKVNSFPCPDANDLGFRVHLHMNEAKILPEFVGVDAVGVGAGCVNELRHRDKWIKALNGGESPNDRVGEDEEFNNCRSQIMWTLREDLRLERIALPDDDELAEDLITPQWKTQNGKIVVEQKEDIKKRLPARRSPNKGDAAGYWNFVRDRTPLVEPLRKVGLTTTQRVWKELVDEDQQAKQAGRYGRVLRQG